MAVGGEGMSSISTLDKKDSILENTNTLIGLPPYLAGQRSSTSPQGGTFQARFLNRAFFLRPGMDVRHGAQGCARVTRWKGWLFRASCILRHSDILSIVDWMLAWAIRGAMSRKESGYRSTVGCAVRTFLNKELHLSKGTRGAPIITRTCCPSSPGIPNSCHASALVSYSRLL